MARTHRLATALVAALLAAGLMGGLGACGPDPGPRGAGSPGTGSPGGSDPGTGVSVPPAEPGGTLTVELDGRPFRLHVPESYQPAERVPLVVVLHGYTSSAAEQESYFQLTAESDRRGFLYAMPDGTLDQRGNRFWNASEACCDFTGTGVDDAGYLRRLIDTVVSAYPVDPARVYLIGHSNGGFMAHRMACEHADVITAIASLAGMAGDPSTCEPTRPVSVLQIHGTADAIIAFDGGENFGRPYPSAEATLAMWRDRNGCDDRPDTSAPALDLDRRISGAETTVSTYPAGCGQDSRVALWSIQDGSHVPSLTPDFTPAVVDFLYAATAPTR